MKHAAKRTAPGRWKEIVLMIACAVIGGVVSLLLGRDVSTDPFSFTLYPAHALWAGRFAPDVFAAGTGPALNPLLFLPYYLTFVKLNAWPQVSLFLNGLSYGFFLFFVWKICSRAFEKQGRLLSVTLSALAVTGAGALANVGAGNGALWLAGLEAWACWLFFYGETPRARQGAFFTASFAVGLSISALPVLAGLIVAAVFGRRARAKTSRLGCTCWAAGGFVLSLSVGVWYAWRAGALDTFGTFFWPRGWAFNLPAWAVKWELPSGVWEWVLLPVWRLRYALPGFLTDPRLACGLLSAVILLGKRVFGEADARETAWSVFFLGAYAVWLACLRDASGVVLLEFAGVLLLGRCLAWLTGARAAAAGAAVLLWVVFPPVMPPERQGVEELNFAFFKEPVLAENSLVLLSGHVSGWTAFLPQDARYAGGVWFDPQDYDPSQEFFLHRLNPLPPGYYSHRRDGAVRAAVRAHDGPVYALLPKDDLAVQPAVWARYGVKLADSASSCQPLYPAASVGAKEFLLCRAEKLSEEK